MADISPADYQVNYNELLKVQKLINDKTYIINDEFINVSFRNNGEYTRQCVNMPITLDQTPIGVISEVNSDYVHGVVWSKFIIERMQENNIPCSVELALPKHSIKDRF